MKPVEPVYRLFGAKIEQLRTLMGLTQEEVGKRTKLTRGSIANIEAGSQRILLHDVEKFSSAFGVVPKALLRGIWT